MLDSFAYHEEDGSFQDIDDRTISLLQTVHPPENCATCHFQEQQTEESTCVVEGGALHYGGHTYHVDDYALYAASGGGPACVGRITEIHSPRPARASTSPKVRVARLGRRSDVGYFPNKMVHEVCISYALHKVFGLIDIHAAGALPDWANRDSRTGCQGPSEAMCGGTQVRCA